MSLAAGTRIGSYEILSVLGAGGMGQVYRARDTRLNRDVAIKILPPAVTADPERVTRFRREAHVLAALNHPNVAQIFDTGRDRVTDGDTEVVYLVMELVPGRTLAELIDTGGPLAPDVAVSIASQIADALEAAHEQGIIHRDLKPANIKRRDDEVVKVLDFGLARAVDASGADARPTESSPTMLSPAATEQGLILGTAGYMSPEQARGRTVDKRADIWAFGVVLYEMLTGRRLFGGDTVTEVIASVIKDAPSLDALPASTPPRLRQLLARCLERDPKLRLRDIGEARIALRTALDTTPSSLSPSPSAPARSRIVPMLLAVTATLALTAIAAVVAWNLKPGAASGPMRRIDLPPAMADITMGAFAPDGNRVAYIKEGHLYVQSLVTARTTDLGTISPSVSSLFWSPDSQTIAYGAESALWTIPAAGGVPFTVCKVPSTGRVYVGTWLNDGTILLAVWRDSLYRVPATGGTPVVHTAIDPQTEVDFHSITALPGGRLILTTHLRGQDLQRADLVDGQQRTPLSTAPDAGEFHFVAPNHLLFRRVQTNPGVWVAPFEGSTIDLSKASLIEPGATGFDTASDGTLIVAVPAKERRELAWVTQTGEVTRVPGADFEWSVPMVNLSPDGKRAVTSWRTAENVEEFFVRDLATGGDTRVPSPKAGTAGIRTGGFVTWRSSARLLFAAGGVDALTLFDWPSDGSANGRALVDGSTALVEPDGTLLVRQDLRARGHLVRVPILPDGSAGSMQPIFPGDNEPNVRGFDLSPDGHLLAFAAVDPTGQSNIFVASYPDLRDRRQVTSDGGTGPRFARDGHSLFFASGTRTAAGSTRGQFKVVTLTTTPLSVGVPAVLWTQGEGPAAGDRAISIGGFDTASDGRLLMTRRVPIAPGDEARMTLIQNWQGAIKK